MSDKNRQIMYALGAGAALIGAALIYHFVSKSDADDDGEQVPALNMDPETISEQLKKSGLENVFRSQNGGLD
jgi:hypothetical protein